MPQPYKVFTIYAREDAQYLEELRGQLRPLENAGRIRVWSDREINPGAEWEKEIVQNLDTADLCYSKELKRQRAKPPVACGPYMVSGAGMLSVVLLWSILSIGRDNLSLSSAPPQKSGLEMILVEGGTFLMGSPVTEQGRSESECQHLVTIASFSIGKYEVTQADWRDIMSDSPSEHKGCDDCPVEQVSWDNIQTFLQKLNTLHPNKNYRLPTESEWEYAARGGKKSAGYVYAGSDTLGKVAWYIYNGSRETHPVGGKAMNELGLYDMSGNVWEWCQDVYKAYPNCKVPIVDNWRVNRGGSAFGYAVYCRSAGRACIGSPYSNPTVGFRLCSDSLQ